MVRKLGARVVPNVKIDRAQTVAPAAEGKAKEVADIEGFDGVHSQVAPVVAEQNKTSVLEGGGVLGFRLRKDDSKIGGARGARALMKAMKGLGTDEAAIFDTLNSASPGERLQMKRAFKTLFGMRLEDRLAEDMSGTDLQKAIGLLRGDDLNAPTPSYRGEYRRMGVYGPVLKGAMLKVAAFLASASWTKGIISKQAEQQLHLAEFMKLDLSDKAPMSMPELPHKPTVAVTPLDALLAKDTSLRAPLTISALHQAFKTGTTTPTDVAKAFLQAVKADETNSFVHVDEQVVLANAAASTARYEKGEPLGPLDGMPIGVKDQIDVKGMPTTCGTSFLAERLGKDPATEDAEVIKNLRAQGANIVGKTLMNELGFGVNGINARQGTGKNAWDHTRQTGGSSSGSGSAVAAGLVVAAVGSDSGGSTRLPASLNGLFGLKPTFGALSNEGNFLLTPSTQQAGPIASTAEDAAMMYAAMAGGAKLDKLHDQDLAGITVGVYRAHNAHADPEIVAASERMEEKLKARGATIKEIVIEDLNLASTCQLVNYAVEAGASQRDYLDERPGYGPDTEVSLQVASQLAPEVKVQADRARRALKDAMDKVLDEVDVVLTPMTGMVAPELPRGAGGGESDIQETEALLRFSTMPSVTGLPALTIPAGLDDDGLPMGVQVVGRAFDEETLLRLGKVAGEVEAPEDRVDYGALAAVQ